ncbi:hypothetical protein STENM36S_07826 [Streptomyces tendae]
MTALLASLGADFTGTTGGDPSWTVTGELPARRVREAELRAAGAHARGGGVDVPPFRGPSAEAGNGGPGKGVGGHQGE